MIESPAIATDSLRFRFGRKAVLDRVSLEVPRGAFYALLGPNGAGKTTLMHILMGIRRNYHGRATVMGRECKVLRLQDRQRIGYVAEGLKLPAWMRVEQLEAYLASLYPTWDVALATQLRGRFELDPKARISTLSRGNYMKVALLCALAPRPELLVLDEPFTGMDAAVKDELVNGLLTTSSSADCTVFLASHDIGELELLANWVGFLGEHSMKLSEPMERVRARFRHVDVTFNGEALPVSEFSPEWLMVQQVPHRLQFVAANADAHFEAALRERFATATHLAVREATLKEVFLSLQKDGRPTALAAQATPAASAA